MKRDLRNIIRVLMYAQQQSPERKKGAESIFAEIMIPNFPDTMKNSNMHIQLAQ